MTAPKTNASSTNVRVVARIRPLSKKELERGSKESITSLASSSSPKKGFDPTSTECMQVVENGQKRFFELDRVFAQDCTQDEIYQGCGAQNAVTKELFNGFNCTILAYGQTGAGKTFTMGSAAANPEGSISDDDGMIPRAVADLFEAIKARCDSNAQVEMSYMEIYNEEIRDLMSPQQKKLVIRERLNGEVYVQGVEYRKVKDPADIGRLMQEASDRRVVASTAMNAVSSRSHAICTLRICGVLENDDKFSSKLTLVDLAGSERIKKTGAQGNRRQEGININKGLFVLGQVVSALSEAGRGGVKRKPPYRDSKLTRLLQDSLGGNSRTIMVACCSPADYNTEESINTLRYATSARNIKNTATRNLVKQISPEEAAKLARENQLLQKQVAELQALLKAALVNGGGGAAAAAAAAAAAEDGEGAGGDGDDQQATDPSPATPDRKKTPSTSAAPVSPDAAAVEVPALHMEIDKLKQQVEELKDVEKDNAELRQQLSDARVDAEAARKAAEQLSNIMDKIQELKEDEIEKKRLEYRHKKKEEQWIDFVYNLLRQQGLQLVKLWYDFELVQRLVTQPIVLKQVGTKTFAMKPKLGYQQTGNRRSRGRGRWFRSDSGDADDEAVAVDDPDEYQMQLLKDHIDFFKKRMREAQSDVERECDDLEGMKASLCHVQQELLAEIGSEEVKQEAVGKENNLLDQLTTMLLQPATVLAAQVPESVLGGDGNTVAESTTKAGYGGDIPRFIDIVPGEGDDDKTVGTTMTAGGTTKRSGWLFRWRGQGAENSGEDDDDQNAAPAAAAAAAAAASSGQSSVASDEPIAGDVGNNDNEAEEEKSGDEQLGACKKTNEGAMESSAMQSSDDKSVGSQTSWFASASNVPKLRSRTTGNPKAQGSWLSGLKDMVKLEAEISAKMSDDEAGTDSKLTSDSKAAAALKEGAEVPEGTPPVSQNEESPPKKGWLGKVGKLVSLENEVSENDGSDDDETETETKPSEKDASEQSGWFSRVRRSVAAAPTSGDTSLAVIEETGANADCEDDDEGSSSTGETGTRKEDGATASCGTEDGYSDCPLAGRSTTTGSASSQDDGDASSPSPYLQDSSEGSDPLADLLMTREWQPKKGRPVQ